MLYLITMIFTFEGLRKVSVEQPLLFATAFISLINCTLALSHYMLSPATEKTHRARDELRIHVFEGDEEVQARKEAYNAQREAHVQQRRRRGELRDRHDPHAPLVIPSAHSPYSRMQRTPPQRSFPMVLHLGMIGYFASDLTLRVVALCVFAYAFGPFAYLLGPAALALWS